MEPEYTIGELARVAEVPTSTLRYYERAGLLAPTGRTRGNYRVYDEPSIERLRFIRAARETGLTIQDIATLLDLRDGATVPCAEIQTLIETRLMRVNGQLRDLDHVREVLESSLALCRDSEATGRCEVLEDLNAAARPSQADGGGKKIRDGSKKRKR